MTLSALLEALQTAGVELAVVDGELRYKGAREALTDDLRSQIHERKAEIITFLAAPSSSMDAGTTSATLPPIHDAPDPHAPPSAPCAACSTVAWRAESHGWRWQWVCGQCRPAPSGGDAPRPRTAAELVAALPQEPCHGGCGKLTPHGWECLSCRTSAGESTS